MANKKIVLLCDSPYATTGLGRVTRYLMSMLPDYNWHIWGINHPNINVRKGKFITPVYNPNDFDAKFKLEIPQSYTQPGDAYGFPYFVKFIEAVKPDIVLTAIDFDRAVEQAEKIRELKMPLGFKWINYFPMDREFFDIKEVHWMRYPDVSVCITKFGVEKLESLGYNRKVEQIWHPIDAKEFPSVSEEDSKAFREQYFSGVVGKDDFLVGTVNRSFMRKDPAKLLYAFGDFQSKQKNAKMYFHGSRVTFEGTDLDAVAKQTAMEQNRVIFPPDGFFETEGVKQEALNLIYRSFDMFVSASQGEGFGFTTVEAMLCELPLITPDNTSFKELVQDFGLMIPSSEMAFHYGRNTSFWPSIPTKEMTKAMHTVHDNYDEYKEKAKAGAKWVKKNLSLKTIEKQWRTLLEK